MDPKHSNPKLEITTANFPTLHTFLRGYFHEDVADEYGTPREAAEQFCEDADTEERTPVAREWQQLMELTQQQPAAFNTALKKLGSAVKLNEEELPQISAIFARYLSQRPRQPAANE